MIAATEKCERAFEEMVQTEEGIRVVKQTLLDLAQVSLEQNGHRTTFSKYLKVNSGILQNVMTMHTFSKYFSD